MNSVRPHRSDAAAAEQQVAQILCAGRTPAIAMANPRGKLMGTHGS